MHSVFTIPIDALLADAQSRFLFNQEELPAVPAIREELGLTAESIVGTYDHLRTPFSNRLIVGDERFAELCRRTGARGVLLVMDCTMPPSTRSRGTHTGHKIGLSDFYHCENWSDAVTADGTAFFSYQPARALVLPSEDYWARFRNACVNMLRNQANIPRQVAIGAADSSCERARSVASLYASCFNDAEARSENQAQALLRVRKRLRAFCGLEPEARVQVVLFSSMRCRIAAALSYFAVCFKGATRFWSFAPPFRHIDPSGHTVGHYEYMASSGRFHLHGKRHCNCLLSHLDLCQLVADGSAVPTTHMIYALLHLGGGVAHFGNSCGMNRSLGIALGVHRPAVDLTHDDSNSYPVGSVEIWRRGDRTFLRNITADLLWQSRECYLRRIQNAVASGNSDFLLTVANAFGQASTLSGCV